MYRILLVDDEQPILASLSAVLSAHGYEIVTARDGGEAMTIFEPGSFDVVITDLKMQPVDGIELLRSLRVAEQDVVVIIMTGYAEINSATKALELGAFDYLTKPLRMDSILVTVGRALAYKRALNGALDLQLLVGTYRALGNLVAESPAMQDVCGAIDRVAPLNVTTLISGEQGTGKALVASTIHDRSHRRNKPFFRIDCKTLEELFAAPAATSPEQGDEPSLLDEAAGGTIFFDSVESATPQVQHKLAAEITQLAAVVANPEAEAEAPRILASTNTNLQPLVDSGTFDGNLYRLLKTTGIALPLLRDRPQDILPLVYQMLKKELGSEAPLPYLGIDACAVFENYSWPGNTHELKETLTYALQRLENGTITRNSLPEAMTTAVPDVPQTADLEDEFFRAGFLKQFLRRKGKQLTDELKARIPKPDAKKKKS